MQSWGYQAGRDRENRENKMPTEREAWYLPESRRIAYCIGYYLKPRLPGGELLSKERRQKEDNRAQVTSW